MKGTISCEVTVETVNLYFSPSGPGQPEGARMQITCTVHPAGLRAPMGSGTPQTLNLSAEVPPDVTRLLRERFEQMGIQAARELSQRDAGV